MPFKGRLLVAHFGHKPKSDLIRYASMVARLRQPQLAEEPDWPLLPDSPAVGRSAVRVAQSRHSHAHSPATAIDSDTEVRFLSLLPMAADEAEHQGRSARAMLRAKVNKFFACPSERLAVACDVLRGQTVRRLLGFATDFGSDLILVGDDGCPRKKVARLAMEAPYPVWIVPSGWAPVLRRILAPIDLSERSTECLQAAIHLARRFPRAKCVALHIDRHDTRASGDTITPARRRELLGKFETLMHGIDSAGVPVVPLFVKGHHVNRAIERQANHNPPDLIVMATRGRSRLAGKLLRSETEAALQGCRGAMLVLKSADRPLGVRAALCERLETTEDPHFS